MTAASIRPLDAVARDRVLRALGVVPMALRALRRPPASIPSLTPIVPASAVVDECITLLLLLPAGTAADARQQALLRAAVACLPAPVQRAPWLEVDAAPPPRARAYLVFGSEALQALGRTLSAAEQQAACVIGVDAPALLLAEPARKRSLWRALKTLRRTLEGAG